MPHVERAVEQHPHQPAGAPPPAPSGAAVDSAPDAAPDAAEDALALLDWRRRTHELYRSVRGHADPLTAHTLWREGRDQMLGAHPSSPLQPEHRAGFAGLAVADYDERYRVEAVLQPAEPTSFEVATGTDGVVPFRRVGAVRLDLPSGRVDLDVWAVATYGGGLFVPLRDGTSGRSTYGGGRYVLDTVKGADLGGLDGRLVVDLNFAYNPSCAYDPAWACPLAPAGNRTDVEVPVGEQHAGPWVDAG